MSPTATRSPTASPTQLPTGSAAVDSSSQEEGGGGSSGDGAVIIVVVLLVIAIPSLLGVYCYKKAKRTHFRRNSMRSRTDVPVAMSNAAYESGEPVAEDCPARPAASDTPQAEPDHG